MHSAPTPDGWLLALYRYRPPGLDGAGVPVILCHGLLSNRFNVDLYEEASLARYLRGRGLDVWVMELRGHGGSRRETGSARFDWTLDDYVQRDLPSVVSYVQRATGAARVHWFGHSLGGMLLYGACAIPGFASRIQSAVVCDAPAVFGPLQRGTRIGRAYSRLVPVVPPAMVLPFLGPAMWVAPSLLLRRHGVGNRRLALRLLANAIIPWGCSRVLADLCRILEAGRFTSADGRLDYEAGLSNVTFPLLVLSAARKLMDERAIKGGYEGAGSAEKSYVRLSRQEGCAEDYTHANILVSAMSSRDVYPRVADWLLAHATDGQNVSV
ncbi:MAG: alpha/beta fold hydrolase [Candidatus Polarisedimenticolia bacterium]